MDDEPTPLRDCIGLVDGDDLEIVRNRSAAFRADVTARFRNGDRSAEHQ